MNKKPTNPIITAIYEHWFSNEYCSVVARAMFAAALRANK
jgi:hypothetical protein